MELHEPQKIFLIKEIKALIDENQNNVEVLKRAYSLAQTVANILGHNGLPDSLGFSLAEYAYECLDVAKGDAHKTAWIDKNNQILTESIDSFYNKHES